MKNCAWVCGVLEVEDRGWISKTNSLRVLGARPGSPPGRAGLPRIGQMFGRVSCNSRFRGTFALKWKAETWQEGRWFESARFNSGKWHRVLAVETFTQEGCLEETQPRRTHGNRFRVAEKKKAVAPQRCLALLRRLQPQFYRTADPLCTTTHSCWTKHSSRFIDADNAPRKCNGVSSQHVRTSIS